MTELNQHLTDSEAEFPQMTVGLLKKILNDYKDDENIEFVFNFSSEEAKEIKFNMLLRKSDSNHKPLGVLIDLVDPLNDPFMGTLKEVK